MNWIISFLDVLLIIVLVNLRSLNFDSGNTWKLIRKKEGDSGMKIEYIVLKGQNFDLMLQEYGRGKREN